jgi:homoserine kinase type II
MKRLLSNYDLKPIAVRPVARRDNDVYRVRTAEGAYALRVHRAGVPAEVVEEELRWLAHLASRLPGRVPEPIATREDGLVSEVYGRVVTVLTWVAGRVPKKPSPALAKGLGGALAAIHRASEGFPLPQRQIPWDEKGHFGDRLMADLDDLQGHATPEELDLFRRRARAVQAAFSRLAGEPRTTLHGDLYPLNVLHQGGRLAVIDFANGGPGPRAYDLAVTLRHAWPAGLDAIQREYERHLPLSETERTHLPHLMQARMLHMAAHAAEKIRRPGGAYNPEKLIAWASKSLREAQELA